MTKSYSKTYGNSHAISNKFIKQIWIEKKNAYADNGKLTLTKH